MRQTAQFIQMPKNKQNVSDTQEQAAETKHAMKKRGAREEKRKWWRLSVSQKQHRKEKSKQNKTPGVFSFFLKSQKNAEQTSESD